MKHENELLIPPAAEEDPKALEVIRVWVAKGGQTCEPQSSRLEGSASLGNRAGDLAGHVANAYEQALGLNRTETMRKITDLLVAELTNPTDNARGRVQNTRPPHRQS